MRASSSLDLRRYFFNFPITSGEGDKDDGRLNVIYQKKVMLLNVTNTNSPCPLHKPLQACAHDYLHLHYFTREKCVE